MNIKNFTHLKYHFSITNGKNEIHCIHNPYFILGQKIGFFFFIIGNKLGNNIPYYKTTSMSSCLYLSLLFLCHLEQ